MKYAIHIGINRYSKAVYGDADLQMCVLDAERMYDFSAQKGYVGLLIRDEAATRHELLSLLSAFAEKMVAGDTLLITQSSHGTYMDTAHGRATGLCMHDDVIWDFELIAYWKRFAQGVNIIRVVDCCFAESNFRALLPVDCRPRFVKLQKRSLQPTQGSLRNCKSSIISLASSSVNEVSYEDANGGVFTTVLLDCIKSSPTFREMRSVSAKSLKIIGYPQTPKLELHKASKRASKEGF